MSDEGRIGMVFDDPNATPPSKILAFDPTKKDRVEPAPVDLDSPFFVIRHREDPRECDHRNRGVTLNMSTRKATCLCGVEIDNFDALLIYAHAQRRLVTTREMINEHARREAEQKARRPFVRDVDGFQAKQTKRGRIIGYRLTLSCKHEMYWDRRKPPRRATCETCFKVSQLKDRGVASTEATS